MNFLVTSLYSSFIPEIIKKKAFAAFGKENLPLSQCEQKHIKLKRNSKVAQNNTANSFSKEAKAKFTVAK